ncbi:lipid droplet-associated triacylglycerol lipase [Diutina catenulata]
MSVHTYPYHPFTTVYQKTPLESSTTPRTLFFIPGNPGLIEFYITYLNIIQQKYPDLELFAISHAGFQTSTPLSSRRQRPDHFHYFDLQYQINHKYEIIRKHILDTYVDTPVDVWIMCHSMGGYIAQRTIAELSKDPRLQGKYSLKFVGLICPTIENLYLSDSGKKFTAFFTWLPVVTIMVFLVRVLNFFVSNTRKMAIIQNRYLESPEDCSKEAKQSLHNSVVAINDLVSSESIVRQALLMTEDELETIRKEDDINDWFFTKLDTKIWAFFADVDHWVANSSRDRLTRKYHAPESGVIFDVGSRDHGIKHAFCVHQSVEFAEITLAQLEHLKL